MSYKSCIPHSQTFMGPLLAALVLEVVGDVLSFVQQEGSFGNLPLPIPLPRCLCGWGSASDLPVASRPSSPAQPFLSQGPPDGRSDPSPKPGRPACGLERGWGLRLYDFPCWVVHHCVTGLGWPGCPVQPSCSELWVIQG